MNRILVYKKTGLPVKGGDEVKTFRGESAKVEGWHEPHKPDSSGRVMLRIGAYEPFPYLPGVIDAEWRDRIHDGKLYCDKCGPVDPNVIELGYVVRHRFDSIENKVVRATGWDGNSKDVSEEGTDLRLECPGCCETFEIPDGYEMEWL